MGNMHVFGPSDVYGERFVRLLAFLTLFYLCFFNIRSFVTPE